MKPIRIIDINFNLLSEIDSYNSLIWTRKFHSISEFELYINYNMAYTETLQIGNIVLFDGMCGIISHKEINLDESGKDSETITIKGNSLTGILAKRITIPPIGESYDIFKANAETVMKKLVENNCINTVSERKIPQLVISVNKNRGGVISWQSRYKQLQEELESLSIISGLGYIIKPDFNSNKWIFDVYESKELTTLQTINNPVIFSTAFDNINSQNVMDSLIGYRNCAVVAGQGEGAEREIVIVGDTNIGLNRNEVFIDARDIENTDDLQPRGVQKLLETERVFTLEADVSDVTFKYKRDWDLGDIVTIQNIKWNITMDARITEIKEIHESNGRKLSVVFGNNAPTFLDRIKQEFKQTSLEVRR